VTFYVFFNGMPKVISRSLAIYLIHKNHNYTESAEQLPFAKLGVLLAVAYMSKTKCSS